MKMFKCENSNLFSLDNIEMIVENVLGISWTVIFRSQASAKNDNGTKSLQISLDDYRRLLKVLGESGCLV